VGYSMFSAENAHLQDVAHFSRCADLNGLEIMNATWVKHSFSRHMHECFAVSLNYGGRGAFECRGELRDAVPGTCNLIAPGEFHTGHATSKAGWVYRNLYMESSLMGTLFESLDQHVPMPCKFNLPLVRDKVLAVRLKRVFASLEDTSSLLQNESLLLGIVARLITHHIGTARILREGGREHVAVRRVKDWLHSNTAKNVSIQALSRVVGLSPYYLIRAFHRQVGVPPHTYQTIVRVNQARTLLKSGASIVDVAHEVGFCDQSHLNRCFKKMLGVTPGEYAGRSVRSNLCKS
jgi:AraC-like DNA-binding protein